MSHAEIERTLLSRSQRRLSAKAGALGQAVWQLDRGLLTSKCACFTLGVYGRAKGTVRSKAEPWNERRVKNVSLGAKGDFRLKAVSQTLNPREFSGALKMALIAI